MLSVGFQCVIVAFPGLTNFCDFFILHMLLLPIAFVIYGIISQSKQMLLVLNKMCKLMGEKLITI